MGDYKKSDREKALKFIEDMNQKEAEAGAEEVKRNHHIPINQPSQSTLDFESLSKREKKQIQRMIRRREEEKKRLEKKVERQERQEQKQQVQKQEPRKSSRVLTALVAFLLVMGSGYVFLKLYDNQMYHDAIIEEIMKLNIPAGEGFNIVYHHAPLQEKGDGWFALPVTLHNNTEPWKNTDAEIWYNINSQTFHLYVPT